jgi:ligand-binding sensor domain-containing protein/signal transduction histidine kinase
MAAKLLLRNLNIFRDRSTEPRWHVRCLMAALAALCFANAAAALDPNRVMSDYVRDRWGVEQGFPGGPVYAIAQTADGYLWIGAEKGLVRFDGLSFRLFSRADSSALPPGPILDLLTDAEGGLWIRPQSRNILRYHDGIFYDAMPDLDSTRQGITAMCKGPTGEVLFAVPATGAVKYSAGRFERLVPTTGVNNFLVISMAETGDGRVWMGTRDSGLFLMAGGDISAIRKGLPDRKINSLMAVDNQGLWIGTDDGVVRWDGAEFTKFGKSGQLDHVQVLTMGKDRDSNVWIGTGNGLLRANDSGVSSMERRDQRSAVAVNSVFEDREGNLWIGTALGLERLRDSTFMTYSVPGELLSQCSGAVYVDDEGRTWFAPVAGGLYWLKEGQTGQVKEAGLDRDEVYSITGSKGELWIGRRSGGLTHLRLNERSAETESYTRAKGLAQNSIYAVYESRDRTVWAGTVSGGVTRIRDGKLTTYTAASGLASNSVSAILESSDGTMWFGTARGMSSLSEGHWTAYGSLDGLPPGRVNCLLEDSRGAIWIGTDNGIAVLREGGIQIPDKAPESLSEPILGLAEGRGSWLWITTSNHILRVDRDRLLGGVNIQESLREFGLADGLLSVEGVRRHRSVVRDAAGRIWLSTNRGLSVVDPRLVAGNSVPAMVHIEGIAADGSAIDLRDPARVRVAAGRQRVTISFAGLSLSIPDRVKFRYMLEGFDQDWSDPVGSREAVYTNLSPSTYNFRVMATNSYGLWNSAEAAVRFEVEPVFWQTWWFRLSCVITIGLAMLFSYRLRMLRLTRQLNMRFEDRLAERTRIAQDLHDTLLQGFLSVSMQLHVAADHLPVDSPAKPLLGRVLELMRQVIDEGRSALKGLRSTVSGPHNLAESFSGIQRELSLQERVGYQVAIEGASRPLHPVIRDEVYRIGREALVNAFRHSRASKIEVVLAYESKHLRVIVRDDGCGIDPEVLRSGREGHWGLSGMRERAEKIGARLRLWSGAGVGTEVELSVPGNIAFESLPSGQRPRWFARLYARKDRPDLE